VAAGCGPGAVRRPALPRGNAPSAAAPAAADSVESYEEVLLQGVARDEAEAAAIAAEAGGAGAAGLPGSGGGARRAGQSPRGGLGRYRVDFESVAGYRASERLNATWRRGPGAGATLFRASLRRDRGRYGGFAELRGLGPVRRVVAGGIRASFGEGMALGVRGVPFGSPKAARGSTPNAGATPTASIWGRNTGGAVTFAVGRHEATAALWLDPDGEASMWGWWTRRSQSGVFGAACGSRLSDRGGDAAVFAEHTRGAGKLAGELCLLRSRWFAAVRTQVRGAATWDLALFSAPVPGGFSAGDLAPGDEIRRQSGCALHRTQVHNGVTTRLSLHGCVRRTGGSDLIRRRMEASIRGRAGARGGRSPGTWSLAVGGEDASELELPQSIVENRRETKRSRRGWLRCGWTGATDAAFHQRYRLSARVDERGGGTVVGTVAWIFTVRLFEASCQVDSYEVTSGHTGYVLQPGLAGPEAVSVVSRSGTDVSARVRLRLRAVRLSLYWDRRWGKPARWYVSAAVRL
jgi:hypothetical protein